MLILHFFTNFFFKIFLTPYFFATGPSALSTGTITVVVAGCRGNACGRPLQCRRLIPSCTVRYLIEWYWRALFPYLVVLRHQVIYCGTKLLGKDGAGFTSEIYPRCFHADLHRNAFSFHYSPL